MNPRRTSARGLACTPLTRCDADAIEKSLPARDGSVRCDGVGVDVAGRSLQERDEIAEHIEWGRAAGEIIEHTEDFVIPAVAILGVIGRCDDDPMIAAVLA